jgi:hypothetical protein
LIVKASIFQSGNPVRFEDAELQAPEILAYSTRHMSADATAELGYVRGRSGMEGVVPPNILRTNQIRRTSSAFKA